MKTDAMKTVLLTVAALCAAALFGLASPRAVAADQASDASAAVKDANTQPDSAATAQPVEKNAATGKEAASAQDTRPVPRSKEASKPAARPLDLSAPPVSHVMTPEQVQSMTAQPDEDDDSQEVMVEQGRYEAPVPRGQIRALAWALMHPLSAWRIFTPVTDE